MLLPLTDENIRNFLFFCFLFKVCDWFILTINQKHFSNANLQTAQRYYRWLPKIGRKFRTFCIVFKLRDYFIFGHHSVPITRQLNINTADCRKYDRHSFLCFVFKVREFLFIFFFFQSLIQRYFAMLFSRQLIVIPPYCLYFWPIFNSICLYESPDNLMSYPLAVENMTGISSLCIISKYGTALFWSTWSWFKSKFQQCPMQISRQLNVITLGCRKYDGNLFLCFQST